MQAALAALGEQRTLGVLVVDAKGEILFATQRAKRILRTPASLVPPALSGLVDAVTSGQESHVARVTFDGCRDAVTARASRLAGTPRHVLITLEEQGLRSDLAASLAAQFGLSARAVQLVQLVRHGLKNREIGERLNLSEATVKTYMYEVYRELGVRNRAELVALTGKLTRGE